MLTEPTNVQTPADMVEYLTHRAEMAERSAHDLDEAGKREGYYRLRGQAEAYREAARIAAVVAVHMDAWYVHI